MEETGAKIILPEKYYHTYFSHLLDFVELHSQSLLDKEELWFIKSYRELGEDAQCLFLRFSNRKGPFFRLDKLSYPEINLQVACEELENKGFISSKLPQTEAVLMLFLKAELLEMFSDKIPNTRIPKAELLEELRQISFLSVLQSNYDVVEVLKQDDFEFLKLLYFGHYKANMSDFVVRDVGHVTLEKLDETQFNPWFKTHDEARALFQISKLTSFIHRALETESATVVFEGINTINFKSFKTYPKAGKKADKLLLELARHLEREKMPKHALTLYRMTNKAPSRERQIRIMDRMGQVDKANKLARKILEKYQNAEELLFAKDFLARPNIRINRSTTALIEKADFITIEFDPSAKVETQAIHHFTEQGYSGIHGENFFWRNLFGLFFWDELYDQSFGNFHNPLQRVSSDLQEPDFYYRRKELIQEKIENHMNPEAFLRKISEVYRQKAGLANPFVYWYDDFIPIINDVIGLMEVPAILEVLREMSKNLIDNVKGFPDILIWKEGEYHFFEIKSPNDHLSPQQLFWIQFMQAQGIQAEVLRLRYR